MSHAASLITTLAAGFGLGRERGPCALSDSDRIEIFGSYDPRVARAQIRSDRLCGADTIGISSGADRDAFHTGQLCGASAGGQHFDRHGDGNASSRRGERSAKTGGRKCDGAGCSGIGGRMNLIAQVICARTIVPRRNNDRYGMSLSKPKLHG